MPLPLEAAFAFVNLVGIPGYKCKMVGDFSFKYFL